MSECKYCGGAKTWGSLKAEMVNNGLTNLANKYREKCSLEGYPYATSQRLSVFVNNLIKTFDKYEKEKLKYQQETYLLQTKLNKAYSKLRNENIDPEKNIDKVAKLETEIGNLKSDKFSLTQKNQELSNQIEKLKTQLQERKQEIEQLIINNRHWRMDNDTLTNANAQMINALNQTSKKNKIKINQNFNKIAKGKNEMKIQQYNHYINIRNEDVKNKICSVSPKETNDIIGEVKPEKGIKNAAENLKRIRKNFRYNQDELKKKIDNFYQKNKIIENGKNEKLANININNKNNCI